MAIVYVFNFIDLVCLQIHNSSEGKEILLFPWKCPEPYNFIYKIFKWRTYKGWISGFLLKNCQWMISYVGIILCKVHCKEWWNHSEHDRSLLKQANKKLPYTQGKDECHWFSRMEWNIIIGLGFRKIFKEKFIKFITKIYVNFYICSQNIGSAFTLCIYYVFILRI